MDIEPFYIVLGRRVQQQRKRQGLSQQALGRRLGGGMTRASVANIENGKQRVLAHTLIQLSEVLGIPLEDLVPKERKSSGDVDPIAAELRSKLSINPGDLRALSDQVGNSAGGRIR